MRNIIVLILIAVGLATGCKTESTKAQTDTVQNYLKYDTSEIAIISWENAKYMFDSANFRSAKLTQEDLSTMDSLVTICVTNYNKELNLPEEHKDYEIDLKGRDYKRQLVAMINSKREKEVWVNCFCHTRDNSWKTQIRDVHDGGPCYFNLKVNLTTKTFFDLSINGFA